MKDHLRTWSLKRKLDRCYRQRDSRQKKCQAGQTKPRVNLHFFLGTKHREDNITSGFTHLFLISSSFMHSFHSNTKLLLKHWFQVVVVSGFGVEKSHHRPLLLLLIKVISNTQRLSLFLFNASTREALSPSDSTQELVDHFTPMTAPLEKCMFSETSSNRQISHSSSQALLSLSLSLSLSHTHTHTHTHTRMPY